MWLAIGLVGLLAALALAMAAGVSLGRYGDNEDEHQYRNQIAEALVQLDERITALEPKEEDDDQPDDLGPLGNAGY